METPLERAIDVIVRVAEPDRILLFGSRAGDDYRSESDYDLIVLKRDVGQRRKLAQNIYLNFKNIGAPVDVIVADLGEYERTKDDPYLIYSDASRNGGWCMRNVKRAMEWLRRAKSNLACAKTRKIFQDILYEDLCFNAQQAVEKALKSLCIIHEIVFPRTYDISYLIELLEKGDIHLPDEVQQSKLLTDYAVATRYPGDYAPVDEEEYETAVKIAETAINWIEGRINGEK